MTWYTNIAGMPQISMDVEQSFFCFINIFIENQRAFSFENV